MEKPCNESITATRFAYESHNRAISKRIRQKSYSDSIYEFARCTPHESGVEAPYGIMTMHP
jgi:hypothetical protein